MYKHSRYYPTHFKVTETMQAFFSTVADSEDLQHRLYNTNTLVEVADIAAECGFTISAGDILRSQAGRVLAMINEQLSEDLTVLIDGGKPTAGAQWGRGSNRYLERAGYWWLNLSDCDADVDNLECLGILNHVTHNENIKKKVIQAGTFAQLADCLEKNGFQVDPVKLLAFQCLRLLKVDDNTAFKIAS